MKLIKIIILIMSAIPIASSNGMELWNPEHFAGSVKKGRREQIEKANRELQAMNLSSFGPSYQVWDHAKKIEQLVRQGADSNVPTQTGDYPLIYAAHGEDFNLVKFLLDNGANPDVQDSNRHTALMEALAITIHYGPEVKETGNTQQAEIINALLKKRANTNLKDLNENTALMYAVADNYHYVSPLLNNGADPNIQNKQGETALMRAIMENYQNMYPTVVELLQKKANPNLQDKWGNTALIYAVMGRKAAYIPLLRKAGADLNIQNKAKQTALDIANENKFEEIIQLLQHK